MGMLTLINHQARTIQLIDQQLKTSAETCLWLFTRLPVRIVKYREKLNEIAEIWWYESHLYTHKLLIKNRNWSARVE